MRRHEATSSGQCQLLVTQPALRSHQKREAVRTGRGRLGHLRCRGGGLDLEGERGVVGRTVGARESFGELPRSAASAQREPDCEAEHDQDDRA